MNAKKLTPSKQTKLPIKTSAPKKPIKSTYIIPTKPIVNSKQQNLETSEFKLQSQQSQSPKNNSKFNRENEMKNNKKDVQVVQVQEYDICFLILIFIFKLKLFVA